MTGQMGKEGPPLQQRRRVREVIEGRYPTSAPASRARVSDVVARLAASGRQRDRGPTRIAPVAAFGR